MWQTLEQRDFAVVGPGLQVQSPRHEGWEVFVSQKRAGRHPYRRGSGRLRKETHTPGTFSFDSPGLMAVD
jgi:hypothetical protein